ncbi:MAG: DUF2007 domain-containing protein [Fibrobacteria bacterium]|nr:DUF2007 domain-containing protein [Fibrobacteria bacterium]
MDPVQTPDGPNRLVEVANLADSLSAEAVRACLEMEGIEAHVFDGEISTMHGWMTNAFGGVKVKVPESDAARARALLAQSEFEIGDEVVPDDEVLDPSTPHCPVCHSAQIRTRAWWSLSPHPVIRFFASMGHTRVTLCRSCGNSWRD